MRGLGLVQTGGAASGGGGGFGGGSLDLAPIFSFVTDLVSQRARGSSAPAASVHPQYSANLQRLRDRVDAEEAAIERAAAGGGQPAGQFDLGTWIKANQNGLLLFGAGLAVVVLLRRR